MSGIITDVLTARFLTRTFVADLLVHIHQKEKIALEIATKVASVNNFIFHIADALGRGLEHSYVRGYFGQRWTLYHHWHLGILVLHWPCHSRKLYPFNLHIMRVGYAYKNTFVSKAFSLSW